MRRLILLSTIVSLNLFARNYPKCKEPFYLQCWATNTVNKWATKDKLLNSMGSYDICLTLEDRLNAYLKSHPEISGTIKERVRGIGDDFSSDLQNACAIVMYGAKY